jgi:hypothetical protein
MPFVSGLQKLRLIIPYRHFCPVVWYRSCSDDNFVQSTTLEQRTSNILRHLTSKIQGTVSGQINSLNLTDIHALLDDWYRCAISSKSISIGGSHMGIVAAEKAEALLSALEKNYDYLISDYGERKQLVSMTLSKNSVLPLVPDQATYNLVCRVYASCDGGKEAAIRAESILGRMIQRQVFHDAQKSGIGGTNNSILSKWVPPHPNNITFNTVLNAWAKSENCGNECEQSFRNMERYSYYYERLLTSQDLRNTAARMVKPNVRSLSAVVEAWTNSNMDYGSDRAVAILETAIEKWIHRTTDQGLKNNHSPTIIKPNNFLVHQVLNALAKSGKGYSAAKKAEQIFHLILNVEENGGIQSGSITDDSGDDVLALDTRTMTLVLECWTNCVTDGDVIPAQNAEHILNEMDKLYSQGKNVKPNSIAYTSCILAWARTNTEQAPEKAESILNRLIRSYEESKDEDLRPTTMPFSACIHSYARSRRPDACARAIMLLEKLKPYGKADTLTYNMLLDVCSKSHERKNSHKLALELWHSMDVCRVERDTVTYTTLIDTITKDGEAEYIEMAIGLLEHMIDQWISGRSHLKPSILSFTDIINGYAKSSQAKKSERAYKVFQRALELSKIQGSDIHPDVRFFSTFISACANENGDATDKRKALKLALQVFSSSMDQYGKPNHYTFSALLKACGRLAEDVPERCRLLEQVFIQCRDEKQVSKSVVYRIQRAFPKVLQMKLLKDCKVVNGSLIVPEVWYENVPRRDRP